jgi:hypothetical protein
MKYVTWLLLSALVCIPYVAYAGGSASAMA